MNNYILANKWRSLNFWATDPEGYEQIIIKSEHRPNSIAFAQDVRAAEIAAGYEPGTFRYYISRTYHYFEPLKRDFVKGSF